MSTPEGVSVMTVIIDGVDAASRGWAETYSLFPGALDWDPWVLRPKRLKWLNNPSGKLKKPCDLGLCKSSTEAKIPAKAWARVAPQAGLNDRHSALTCVHATLLQEKGEENSKGSRHNRRHQGRSYV